MAFNQVTATSLTPTRPAPSAPGRNGPSSYGSSFSVGTSSPSGSSYAASYSGIGGSPNRASDSISSAQFVRCGIVSVKEDGIVSWLWRPKWLVLKEQSLLIHKNEVRISVSPCARDAAYVLCLVLDAPSFALAPPVNRRCAAISGLCQQEARGMDGNGPHASLHYKARRRFGYVERWHEMHWGTQKHRR